MHNSEVSVGGIGRTERDRVVELQSSRREGVLLRASITGRLALKATEQVVQQRRARGVDVWRCAWLKRQAESHARSDGDGSSERIDRGPRLVASHGLTGVARTWVQRMTRRWCFPPSRVGGAFGR